MLISVINKFVLKKYTLLGLYYQISFLMIFSSIYLLVHPLCLLFLWRPVSHKCSLLVFLSFNHVLTLVG